MINSTFSLFPFPGGLGGKTESFNSLITQLLSLATILYRGCPGPSLIFHDLLSIQKGSYLSDDKGFRSIVPGNGKED